MMTKLEMIEQEISDNDIILIENRNIDEKSVIINDNDNILIGINDDRFKNNIDKVIALSHELGHFYTGGYYKKAMRYTYKAKLENWANIDSVLRLLPVENIKEALYEANCTTRWELSEYLNYPEDFIDKAVRIYQKRGELPYKLR